jgi:Predicted membrane protein (DUF2157).
MSHNLNSKHQAIVAREIKSWREQKLIDKEITDTLLQLYPLNEAKANISGVLSLVGCILIGLGTLLFIGTNWQAISVGGKLGIITLAIVLSHYLGWRLRFEPGTHPKLGASILVLGSLFFGGGIWLVSQAFNMDINISDGLFFWAFGTIASALVTRLVPLGCLSAILISGWALANHSQFSYWAGSSSFSGTPYFLTATAVGLLTAAYLRSRSVIWITLSTGCLWMAISTVPLQALLLWGLACFGGFLYCREQRDLFSAPFLYTGTITTLSTLLIATFTTAQKVRYDQYEPLVVCMVIAMITLLFVAWQAPKYALEVACCIFIGVATCLNIDFEGSVRLVSNLIMLGAIAGLGYTGLNRVHSKGAVNIALVFFVFDIIARYSDYFYTMMNRSLFFIGGGIVLVTAGWLAERGRQKLLQNFELVEAPAS